MNFASPPIGPHHKPCQQSPCLMSNSNKTNKVFNSSIRKYLNLNIEKPSIAKQNMEFSHFQKTPIKLNPIPPKKENCSPMRTPNIKLETFSIAAQNKNDVTFSGFSKMSYDSQTEEINFDHCQYIEIMQNLQKGQIKLYSHSKDPTKKKSIKLLDTHSFQGALKKDISDFAGFLPQNKLSLHGNNKKYECKYCGAAFNKPCALGGHMSKMHKGRSRFFKKRKEKREMRETERQRNTFFKNIFKQNC